MRNSILKAIGVVVMLSTTSMPAMAQSSDFTWEDAQGIADGIFGLFGVDEESRKRDAERAREPVQKIDGHVHMKGLVFGKTSAHQARQVYASHAERFSYGPVTRTGALKTRAPDLTKECFTYRVTSDSPDSTDCMYVSGGVLVGGRIAAITHKCYQGRNDYDNCTHKILMQHLIDQDIELVESYGSDTYGKSMANHRYRKGEYEINQAIWYVAAGYSGNYSYLNVNSSICIFPTSRRADFETVGDVCRIEP